MTSTLELGKAGRVSGLFLPLLNAFILTCLTALIPPPGYESGPHRSRRLG